MGVDAKPDEENVHWPYGNQVLRMDAAENTPWEKIDFMTDPFNDLDVHCYGEYDVEWGGFKPNGDDMDEDENLFVDVVLEEGVLEDEDPYSFYVPLRDMIDMDDSVAELAPPLLALLHTMRLVDLLTRKRALESRIAAASFVRALTHTSQPVPQWVMAPELKLGALLDDTLVALRNRARELPELPKGSVFPEDDAVDSVTVAEAAAVVASSVGGSAAKSSSNATPQTTVKNSSASTTGDRHTKKRSDAANGGRKDRARADKRGYVPSRSKRGGGGAYGWGAAPTAVELVEWEADIETLTDDEDDYEAHAAHAITGDWLYTGLDDDQVLAMKIAHAADDSAGLDDDQVLAMKIAHAADDFEASELASLTISELYSCKRAIEKELAAATFVRALTHKSQPIPAWFSSCIRKGAIRTCSPEPASAFTTDESALPLIAGTKCFVGPAARRIFAPEHEHRADLHAVVKELKIRGEKLALPDEIAERELSRVPLSALKIGELYTRKRAIEKDLAAATFVRALTHKSQPIPAWVLEPEHEHRCKLHAVVEELKTRGDKLRLPDDESYASVAAVEHPGAVYLPVKAVPEPKSPLLMLSKKSSKRASQLHTRIRYLETQGAPPTPVSSPSSITDASPFETPTAKKSMPLEQIAEWDPYAQDATPTASSQRESVSAMYAELAALKANALKSAQNYHDAKALSDKSDEHKSKGKGKGKGGAHAMRPTSDAALADVWSNSDGWM